jgi:hypothetical protein
VSPGHYNSASPPERCATGRYAGPTRNKPVTSETTISVAVDILYY